MSDSAEPKPAKRMGRPPKLFARRINIWITEEALAIAKKIGAGNVSAGVRRALKAWKGR